MARYAIFVDAGYFSASAAKLLVGSPRRNRVKFDFPKMREELKTLGDGLAGQSALLRIYWYDGSKDARPSSWHDKLGNLPDVKLRLGHLRGGHQKGVDTLLVLDLILLAEQRAVSDAVLIGGDEDLREGVSYMQARGIRLHLVTAVGSESSGTLLQEADTTVVLDADFFKAFSSEKPAAV